MTSINGGITCGGRAIVCGGATEYQTKRLELWSCTKNNTAVKDLLEGHELADFKTYREFILFLVKQFYLSQTTIEFLRELHERIATKFVEQVEKNMQDVTVDETPRNYTPNYTPSLIRLKSFRFNKWTGEDIKGFCPFEPLIRLDQLLSFPIDQFDTAELPAIDIPDAPQIDDHALTLKSEAEFCAAVVAAKSDIKKWENYYTDVCQSLSDGLACIN
jgi:hypothetical protein